MEKETWERLKRDWAVIFTAAAVGILSSAMYNKPDIKILSKEFVQLTLVALFIPLITTGIIYLILYAIYRFSGGK